MKLPEFQIQVTHASSELRSFRDRVTGQSREFCAVSLAGFSSEQGAIFSLSCPESLKSRVNSIKVGDKVKVSLRSFEAKNGLIEGQVGEIL